MSAVTLKGVSKAFEEGAGQRVVIDRIDLCLERESRTALLGQSGSGKSTLLHLISGLDAPDAGEIWIGDRRIDVLSETQRTLLRRRQIGIVFQAFDLIPTLNVIDNVLLGLDLDGRRDRVAIERGAQLLERVGLGDRAHSAPDLLSGGEQQRVAIARALVHRPALVLADEPTGNLDATTGAAVLDLIDELTAAEGAALLMVTHSEIAAARMTNVLELRDGACTQREPTPQ